MPAMRWPPSLIVGRTIRGRKLLQSLCLSRVAARLACNPTLRGSMDRWAAQRRAIHKRLLKWRPPVLQAIAVFLMTTAGASIFDWLADEDRSGVPILGGIPISVTNSGEVFDDDVLLALVTTRALAETPDSHAAFISEVESCYDLAKAKFNNLAVARQLIVLAGPPSIAALAGSALRDQGLWHTLNHNSNANTYELSFERGRPS